MMRSTDALRPWQPYRSYPVRMFTRMVLRNCANLRSYILEFWLATSCRSLILLSVICDNSLDISCIFLLSKFYQMRHNSWTTLSFKQQSIITSEMCQRRFEFLWMIGLHSFAKKHHLKIADTCTMHSPISVLCRKIGPHGKSVSCSLSIRSSIEMNEVASKLKVLRFFLSICSRNRQQNDMIKLLSPAENLTKSADRCVDITKKSSRNIETYDNESSVLTSTIHIRNRTKN